MVFNANKYKVLHFGHNNGQVHYVMDGNILESVEEERDLGVIIQRNLKVDKQCAKAAKTANSVLIRRSFINKGVDIIYPYTSFLFILGWSIVFKPGVHF